MNHLSPRRSRALAVGLLLTINLARGQSSPAGESAQPNGTTKAAIKNTRTAPDPSVTPSISIQMVRHVPFGLAPKPSHDVEKPKVVFDFNGEELNLWPDRPLVIREGEDVHEIIKGGSGFGPQISDFVLKERGPLGFTGPMNIRDAREAIVQRFYIKGNVVVRALADGPRTEQNRAEGTKRGISCDGKEIDIWVAHPYSVCLDEDVRRVIRDCTGYGTKVDDSDGATNNANKFTGRLNIWIDDDLVGTYEVVRDLVVRKD